jgi:hypothetical protein
VIGAFEWSSFASSAILLVLGAALTSLLIPFVTRRWQNHQKELELKADLLRRVSDAVTRMITHGWFTRLAGKTWGDANDRLEFTWGFGEWLTDTRVLEAELQAYFQGDDGIRRHWATYCELLRAFHELTWNEEGLSEAEQRDKRSLWLGTLRTIYESSRELWEIEARRRVGLSTRSTVYSATPVQGVEWNAFLEPAASRAYIVKQWPTLKLALEAPLAALGAAILGTPMEPLNDWRF